MRFSKEEKAMWLEDWRQSGKRVWTYAKENGLSPQTFSRWTRSETESKPCFIEVPAKILPPSRHDMEILIEKGDVKIHIPMSIGSVELRAVMEGIRSSL